MKRLLLMLSIVVLSPTTWAENPDPASCLLPHSIPATPNWFAVIEVGAKGVKPVAVQFEGLTPKTTDQFPTRDVVAYEATSLPNVVQTVCETIAELHKKYGNLPIHVVGSSGISQVSHRPALEAQLEKTTGKKIEFITAEQEMAYLGKGIWGDLPVKRRCDSALVDIGSGNVKGGYVQGCNPEKITPDEKFMTFNVNDFGVAAFTKKASDQATKQNIEYSQAAEIIRKQLEAELIAQVEGKPELTSGKKRVYLVGGAAWALSTMLCLDCDQYASRSETMDQDKYTVIKPSDIEEFYRFVKTFDEHVCDSNHPNPYVSSNLDNNVDAPLPSDKLNKQQGQIAKVCSKFSINKNANELLSAAEILRAISKALNINQQRNLFFMQGNLHTWSQEYLVEKIQTKRTPEKAAVTPLQWHSVGEQKSLGIGGIAVIDDKSLLVVHDGKKPEHPRLSVITLTDAEKPTLKPQEWCDSDSIPVDLEAITAVPGYKKDFLVLESKGAVTRIRLEPDKCKVIAHIVLPTANAESNMESLTLHCFKKRPCVLAWAERGDEKIAAQMSWAIFNADNNKLTLIDELFEFDAPYPVVQHRSISDMAIDNKGTVLVSAVSDPGDEGPFQSAIYKLGQFSANKQNIKWQPAKEAEQVMKFENENLKVEGLTFNKGRLFMGTDDENKGAKLAEKPML